MSISKISVDLRARSFAIEVPDDRVDSIFVKLEELFRLPMIGEEISHRAPPKAAVVEEVSPEGTGVVVPAASKKRRGQGNAKVRSYELIELGLGDDQRKALREFYNAMAPKQQNDSVATLIVKLKEFLGRNEFDADQIHSAFKIVDRPTPKNLIAVFANMKRDGRAGYSSNKVIANSHTDDYVRYHMNMKKEVSSKK